MKTVALLLDDEGNKYQQLLAREARVAADRHGLNLLAPEFAGGSSWPHVQAINTHLRRQPRIDAIVVLLAGELLPEQPFERLVKAGVAVVLLNRIPSWAAGLRDLHPGTLLAAVAPHQEGIGVIQARQALHLVRPGGFVILMAGTAASPTAMERKRGFVDTVAERFGIHELEGRWSASEAEKALTTWLRFGADRNRPLDLIVCQNDAMAVGARKALTQMAASTGQRELGSVQLIGCDGLQDEGQALIAAGDLAATVIVPPTTPAAIDLLVRYWQTGAWPETIFLDATPFPSLDKMGTRPA